MEVETSESRRLYTEKYTGCIFFFSLKCIYECSSTVIYTSLYSLYLNKQRYWISTNKEKKDSVGLLFAFALQRLAAIA